MLKRIAFPDFTPDQQLTTADISNVQALPVGYRPVKAFSPVTDALPGILGGAAFVGSDGPSTLLGGTTTDLHKFSGGAWSSVLGSLSATVWRSLGRASVRERVWQAGEIRVVA